MKLACPLCTLEEITTEDKYAYCLSCGLQDNVEHFRTYEQYKSEDFYEYERTFIFVEELPENAEWGDRFRHKNACECGRDLMVLVGANEWCSSGAKTSGGPCEYSKLIINKR